jgi:hypothetical protein
LAAAITIVIAWAADPAHGAIVRELPPMLPATHAPTTRPSAAIVPPDAGLLSHAPVSPAIPPLRDIEPTDHGLLGPAISEALLIGPRTASSAVAVPAQQGLQAPKSAPLVAAGGATPTGENAPSATPPQHIGPAPEIVQVPPVPEPSTGVLLLTAGVAALTRRTQRRRRSASEPSSR